MMNLEIEQIYADIKKRYVKFEEKEIDTLKRGFMYINKFAPIADVEAWEDDEEYVYFDELTDYIIENSGDAFFFIEDINEWMVCCSDGNWDRRQNIHFNILYVFKKFAEKISYILRHVHFRECVGYEIMCKYVDMVNTLEFIEDAVESDEVLKKIEGMMKGKRTTYLTWIMNRMSTDVKKLKTIDI